MKIGLYGITILGAFAGLALLVARLIPFRQSSIGIGDRKIGGLGLLISMGGLSDLAILAIALAVIPLCIAVAYDRISS